MKPKGLSGVTHGMSGIPAAIKPHDHIGFASQVVDYLTFALISPLGTNYHCLRAHEFLTSLQYHI